MKAVIFFENIPTPYTSKNGGLKRLIKEGCSVRITTFTEESWNSPIRIPALVIVGTVLDFSPDEKAILIDADSLEGIEES